MCKNKLEYFYRTNFDICFYQKGIKIIKYIWNIYEIKSNVNTIFPTYCPCPMTILWIRMTYLQYYHIRVGTLYR